MDIEKEVKFQSMSNEMENEDVIDNKNEKGEITMNNDSIEREAMQDTPKKEAEKAMSENNTHIESNSSEIKEENDARKEGNPEIKSEREEVQNVEPNDEEKGFVMINTESESAEGASEAAATMEEENSQEGEAYKAEPSNAEQGSENNKSQKEASSSPEGNYNKKSKSKNNRAYVTRRGIIAAAIACVTLSTALGFGGGYLAANLSKGGSVASGDGSVLYQSVVKTSSNSDSSQEAIVNITNSVANSVVEITTESTTNYFRGQYVTEGAGSGVIVTSDGYIVTNNHVINGASKISVRLKDGTSYDATLIGTDAKTDLAIIKIEADKLQAAVLGNSDNLQVGELAVAIGNPLGELGGTVTSGIISALDREIVLDGETMNLLQTSAAINPGNSGGGLFDKNGDLVGIVVAKSSGENVEGLGFAIPINDAKDVINQLMSQGYVAGRGITLGVRIVNVDDDQKASYYHVNKYGVYIVDINSGSNAERAGLQAGDCILSVNGTSIKTADDLTGLLGTLNPGDELNIEVLRGGSNVKVNITAQ